MTRNNLTAWALAFLFAIAGTAAAMAQDSNALIDALVKKKILTAQEAEDVRADLIKENAAANAGKLRLADSVSSLKLYGDIRLRYQYDNKENQVAGTTHDNQRSRERIRLRLGADFTLTGGFFGGLQLQTCQAADSGNQSLADSSTGAAGFGNYNIYISKAYFGWANDWLTLVGGKQANPFYTTDLVWDADINPAGAAEKIDLIKAFGALVHGNSDVRSESPFGLSLVAGQFILNDNNEYNTSDKYGNATHDAATDSWLFATQLIASYQFTPSIMLTVAPGYMTFTNGNTADLNNESAFMTTKSGSNLLVNIHNDPISSQRDLSIVTAPGDISFKLCGLKTKVLWDFAYNTQGSARAENVYGMTGKNGVSGYSSRDDIAWLAGIQLGENKKAGDWSVIGNFRQTGLASVDPNLNDSDFALGYLNMQGIKVGVNYNLTDFCVAGITYFDAWNLRGDLYGGHSTSGEKIASVNSVQIVQLDLNLKF